MDDETENRKRHRYNSYSIEYKMALVKRMSEEGLSLSQASRLEGVPRSTIQRWKEKSSKPDGGSQSPIRCFVHGVRNIVQDSPGPAQLNPPPIDVTEMMAHEKPAGCVQISIGGLRISGSPSDIGQILKEMTGND